MTTTSSGDTAVAGPATGLVRADVLGTGVFVVAVALTIPLRDERPVQIVFAVVSMVLFAPIPLPPELKFVFVAATAIPACFTVGYTLTQLPGASKVL